MTTFLEALTRFFSHRRTGYRLPAKRAVSTALTGAVMIWTQDGNVVLDPDTARKVARKLAHLAVKADSPMGLSCESDRK